MARNDEVELKFLVEKKGVGFEAFPVLAGAVARCSKTPIETTYYDTAAQELDAHGLTVRLRKTPQKRILSVKSSGSNGISRREREVEIGSRWPSTAEWKAVGRGSPLDQAPVRRRLKPLCTTKVDRIAVDVEWKNATIETSLDQGKVKAKSGMLPIRELELEIKKGRTRDLFAFAQELHDRLPLRISLISKGKRGTLLANDRWARPQGATLPELQRQDNGSTALQKICTTCLKDFMINEVAITGPDPVEGVHKSRIAVRRLRSAMALFRPVLSDSESNEIASELKWISDELGHVRDLDVAVAGSASWGARVPGVRLLSKRLKAARAQARRALQDVLRSHRLRSFLFNFIRWLEIGNWKRRSAKSARMPIPRLAGQLLQKRLGRLLRDAKNLADRDAEALHDVRKEAKKLRYMGEFFLSLTPGEQRNRKYEKLLESLEDVQKALGKVQDRVALEELLRSQIHASDDNKTRAALGKACESILMSNGAGDHAERKKAVRAFRKIRTIQPDSQAVAI